MDCWFEVAVGRWSDWTCAMPVLVVDALAESVRQLLLITAFASELTCRICIVSRWSWLLGGVYDRV